MSSTGSVQHRGKNSWFLVVCSGSDGSGKRLRHTKTVKVSGNTPEAQEKEARRQLALFIAEIERGQIATSGKMTLTEFFDYWLENHAEGRHEPKTINYNKGLFKRIKEAMGRKRLDKIEPRNLLAFYKNLAEAGIRQDPNEGRRKVKPDDFSAENKADKPRKDTLSPNTIKKYHVLLHTLLEKAHQWQFITYNPAAKVEPPKNIRQPKSIYDEEITGKFLLLLEGEHLRHRAMALLSLASGMRRGELFGLEWQHVDEDNCSITIEQASQYLPEKGIFTKSTKNESSKRIVTVSESIIALLKQLKAEQNAKRLKLGGTESTGGKWAGAESPDNDRILTTWNGAPAHPDSMNTWLKNFVSENGLPPLTPHDFRHMAATYLITSGTDVRTVAGKLGHKNSTTTQLVYSHLLKSTEKETATTLENFMQQATEKAKQAQKKQAR
ncbi:MAG: tyrosine-type recombinase/integrase [Negativicutes bacterium]|nr:tyrosine-type recombinase/integrase [Negativicutes bacterium]